MKILKIMTSVLSVSLVVSSAFAEGPMQPSESACLASASVAAAKQLSKGQNDYVVATDPRTGLVSKITNLTTDETFELDYLSTLRNGQEFISFASDSQLLNITAKAKVGNCKVVSAKVIPYSGARGTR